VLTAEGKKARTTARKQKWRADNPEKVRASIKKSYEKHKAKRLADNKAWHAANRDKANARMRKWREANQEKARAHVQKWQENNREKYLARMREWRANNAAYCVAFRRNKNIESPEKLAAARVKRRARKLGATPSWLTKDQLGASTGSVARYLCRRSYRAPSRPACMRPSCAVELADTNLYRKCCEELLSAG
jgi:hypothetical protein